MELSWEGKPGRPKLQARLYSLYSVILFDIIYIYMYILLHTTYKNKYYVIYFYIANIWHMQGTCHNINTGGNRVRGISVYIRYLSYLVFQKINWLRHAKTFISHGLDFQPCVHPNVIKLTCLFFSYINMIKVYCSCFYIGYRWVKDKKKESSMRFFLK